MKKMPELIIPDPMQDFERLDVELLGRSKLVFKAGSGPAVIVMTEMPGISPYVVRFARFLCDSGFTVWIPNLFGDPGQMPTVGRMAKEIAKACVSREFRMFAANKSSPVTAWLRALAAHVHPLSGGKGVGAIGMCFTGNFALSMMLEPAMLAPVLSQPSLPMLNAGGLHIAPDELSAVRVRMERDDLTALGYRFMGDGFCKAARFEAYAEALGNRFVGHVLPDESANKDAGMAPHSVVTLHLIDAEGEPTRIAVDEILAFFKMRLLDA